MAKKRSLTEYEIDQMISFIKPQKGIPEETAMSVVEYNKDRLRKQLKKKLIYPCLIPALMKMTEDQYNKALIQTGESVGVLGAQSIGEKQTQSTLNTFHKAGSGAKSANTGVPRVEELLNATRDPKITNCFIYFNKGNNSIREYI